MRRWNRFKGGCLVLACSLLFAACGSGGSGDSDVVPGDVPVGEGHIGKDFITTDGSHDIPKTPKVECTTDAECFGENRVCDCQGKCTDAGTKACEEDKNCGSGFYCDPCLGYCYPQGEVCEPCGSENLCNPLTGECRPRGNQCARDGSRCLDYVSGGSFCGRGCLGDAGCPMGYTCMDLAQFGIPAMQCVPNTGSCNRVRECEEDRDCELHHVCNTMHQCALGCQVDTECPTGKVCISARCKEACDPVNNPCAEGLICNDKGKCLPPGGCADAYDCPQPETYCNEEMQMCVAGCLDDRDCKSAAKLCENKVCVRRGCTANFWCSFGEVCTLDSGDCVIPPEPFCEPCAEDAECGPDPAKCLELQDEEGTSQGKFCFVGCYPDPDNECPQGYQCVELTDQDGASQGEVCARTCYQEPVGLY